MLSLILSYTLWGKNETKKNNFKIKQNKIQKLLYGDDTITKDARVCDEDIGFLGENVEKGAH